VALSWDRLFDADVQTDSMIGRPTRGLAYVSDSLESCVYLNYFLNPLNSSKFIDLLVQY